MTNINFHNQKIGIKLIIGFSTMIFFICFIGLVGFLSSNRIQKNLKDILNNRLMAMDYLIEADRDLQQLLVAERSMIIADPKDEMFSNLLSDYEENAQQSIERWEKYKKLNPFPEEKALFSEYEQARQKWEKISREIVKACQSNKQQDQRRALKISLGQGKQKFEEMRDYINQLEEINLDIAKKLENQAAKSYLRQTILSISLIIIGIFLGLMLILIIRNSVAHPVKQMVNMIQDIAKGEGDLTGRLNIKSKDEIGEMAQWFNVFVDKLHNLISNIKQTSEKVATATHDINTTSAQFASGAEEQMDQTGEVAASVQEVNTAITKNSEKAKETAQLAEQSNETVNVGLRIMQETINGMNAIADSVDNIGSIVNSLIKHAEKIEGIIKVINDLASQTNVLALNASIEAVKAGESGKGFSVVAKEVKLLVDQTTQSTKRITETITEIQTDVDNIAVSMKDMYKVVDKGKENTMNSEKALKAINHFVSRTQEKVDMIAQTSEEQSMGVNEVFNAITLISSVSKQSAAGSEQLAEATEELNKQTQYLKNLVEYFKLRNNDLKM